MSDDVSRAVGQRVGKAMREAGVTQKQVAEALGTTQSEISRRISADRRMAFDIRELAVIARMCGVTPSSFLEEVAA